VERQTTLFFFQSNSFLVVLFEKENRHCCNEETPSVNTTRRKQSPIAGLFTPSTVIVSITKTIFRS